MLGCFCLADPKRVWQVGVNGIFKQIYYKFWKILHQFIVFSKVTKMNAFSKDVNLLQCELLFLNFVTSGTTNEKKEIGCFVHCKSLTKADYVDLTWTTFAEFPGEFDQSYNE